MPRIHYWQVNSSHYSTLANPVRRDGWRRIGNLLDRFPLDECANCIREAGYATPSWRIPRRRWAAKLSLHFHVQSQCCTRKARKGGRRDMHRIIAWGQGIGGLVILAFAVAGNAEPPSISSTEATQILKSFGLRVAACNPDSPIEMTDIQTARAAMTHLVDMRAKAIAIYPVKGRFVGHCTGGTAASGRIDTFTISGKFQTNLYKDDFGDWKHTPVLRPECEQVRTSYQITGQPAVPANDQSICDYTAPR